MENKYLLYRHIRLDKNEPFYIGIGNSKRPFEKRRRNKYWHNITNTAEYEIEVLINNLTWDEACVKEKEFIKLYGRKDQKNGCLVNMTDGGDGSINVSQEVKNKIIEKNLKFRHTEETKKFLSQLKKGRIGYKHTKETKLKISNAKKGKANAFYGKKHTEETLQLYRKRIPANKGISKYDLIEKSVIEDIKLKLTESQLSNKYNISKGAINRIKKKLK